MTIGRCAAALLLMLLAPTTAHAVLGLCRQEAARSDAYMQLLCQGESALDEKQPRAAIRHFSAAAELPRLAASNELAWAGLAVAHCTAGDLRDGRDWAQRFEAARRIWSGELACQLDNGTANPKIPPQVQRQLCTEALAPDYAIVRAAPQSAVAQDIRARLDAVQKSVTAACATGDAAKPAGAPVKKPSAKKKKVRVSGKARSPAQER